MTPQPEYCVSTLMMEQGLHCTSAPTTSPTTTLHPYMTPSSPTYSPTHFHSGQMSLAQGPTSVPSPLPPHHQFTS